MLLAITVGACAIYLGDSYRADNKAIGAFLPQGTTWKEEPDGTIVFEPEGATKGFIFYPGGRSHGKHFAVFGGQHPNG